MTTAHPKLAELISLLDLEPIDSNLFRGVHPKGRKRRLFGGQIMAQAYMAAARTVPDDRYIHSLHGYFLLAGDPSVPAVFTVDRIRDGRSFTTRRVVVIQRGRAIFTLDASFQRRESGYEHQLDPPDREPPDEAKIPAYLRDAPFVSWRHDHRRLLEQTPQPPRQDLWFRANGEVPEDPLIHTALLVYESDGSLLSTARLPHRGSFEREHLQMASLDHAMWFHAPVRVDGWLLYSLDSPTSAHARGFNRGHIFTKEGTLVASTMQEGLMRHHPPA